MEQEILRVPDLPQQARDQRVRRRKQNSANTPFLLHRKVVFQRADPSSSLAVVRSATQIF
ncbi:MAG: hypothetical protein DMG40_18930 [Acidobacteria bacterium]|nr:MAG: hypothetical protein DMG40_18930 [Acidobacteriota bacterium]